MTMCTRLAAALAVALTLAAPVSANDSTEDFGWQATRASAPAAPRATAALARIACAVPAEAGALRAGMLQAVNARRAAAGLRPLGHDGTLDNAAAVIACDNAQRGVMDHVATREGDLRERMHGAGYRFRTASEALAYGYRAPDRLAGVWYNSAYHYPTLMTPQSEEAGIAIVQSANGTLWWAMISAQPR